MLAMRKGGEGMFDVILVLIYFLVCLVSLYFGQRLYRRGFRDGLLYERLGKVPMEDEGEMVLGENELDREFEEIMAYDGVGN